MAITEVVQSPGGQYALLLPVSGAGSSVPVGTLMMPGATGGTNLSIAIPVTASSNARALGVLIDKHDFSASGDATTATLNSWFPNGTLATSKTQFPSRNIQLFGTAVIIKVDYDLTSTVAVASYSAGTITITSFEASFDGGFVYCNAGTGIGQLGFVASSSSGSCVLTAALTTALDSTSKLTKILPHLYATPVWKVNSTTVPTRLDSTAAVGTGRAVVLSSSILKNDQIPQRLDPLTYHNMQSLNAQTLLAMNSHLAIQDAAFFPIS
jgi:hypothetical protein